MTDKNLSSCDWEYRPVRNTKTGEVTIREVYFNIDGDICYIEPIAIMPYTNNSKEVIDNLKNFFPMVESMKKYNSNLLEDLPEQDLAEWKFSNE